MTYTDEELDILACMEDEWRNTLPRYSFYEWVEIFSDEKRAIATALRAKLKELKEKRVFAHQMYDIRRRVMQKRYALSRSYGKMAGQLDADYEEFLAHLSKEEMLTKAKINYLTGKKPKEGTITDADIQRARAIPVESLIKVRRDRKALCPFHSDKNPSLHVYKDNHVYCFSCKRHGDSINIYMALNHCRFKDAVRRMLSL